MISYFLITNSSVNYFKFLREYPFWEPRLIEVISAFQSYPFQPAVLIHRVQRSGASYYSILISQSKYFYELTEGTEWVTFLEPDLVGSFQMIKVSVRKMYAADVDISITSTFDPAICRLGELRKTVMDTRYGISSVCIRRNRAHLEIREAELRKQYEYENFFAMRATFGANECKAGFVWRAIDEYDYVCVPPQRQEIARAQSELQSDRLQFITVESRESRAVTEILEESESNEGGEIIDEPLTSNNSTDSESSEVKKPVKLECVHPYVKRDAFVGDEICVTYEEQKQTVEENIKSINHLRHYEFFNGVDTVGP